MPSVPTVEDVVRRRLVGLRVLLRGEEDVLVARHRRVERVDRPLAADEELRHHVREHDDVPQRQKRHRALLHRPPARLSVRVLVEETSNDRTRARLYGQLGFFLVDDERRLALRDDVLVDDDFFDAASATGCRT